MVDVLHGSFQKDDKSQKKAWVLVFLNHDQAGSEMVPYLILHGNSEACS